MEDKKKKIEICFALHADYNIIDLVTKANKTQLYTTIFSNLYNSPSIPFTFALSGNFLEWIQKNNSSFFDVIAEMVKRKQFEILGNAFYEPFISVIPPNDLVEQIEYMTDSLRKYFYKRPRGMYLPYFAWNQNVITNLKKCNIEYCLLDSRFFSWSNLDPLSPVCMEDYGKIVFGIPSTLEFENTEYSPKSLYDILVSYASPNNESCLVIFLSPENLLRLSNKYDDGKSWLEEFIELSKNENSILSVVNAGQIVKEKSIYQKGVIAPNAVFANKPVNNSIKYLLAKQPHLYAMYAKITYVHTLVTQIRGDKSRKKNALLDLWCAETGSLFNLDLKYEKYNKQLRNCCYRNLLKAEKQSRLKNIFEPSLSSIDFDLDGLKEFLSQRENINMYVHALGGKVFELDIFTAYKNYADISAEQTGLFIDHLLSIDELELIKNGENLSAIAQPVFANSLYQDVKVDRHKCELQLRAAGAFRAFNQPVSLRKQYNFNDYGTQVQYILKNESSITLSAYFMTEIDLPVSQNESRKLQVSVYSNEQRQEVTKSNNKFENLSLIQIYDPDGKTMFTIEPNEVCDLIVLPIFEKLSEIKNTLAALRILFYWRIDLKQFLETEKLLFLKIEPKKIEKKKHR